MGLIYEVGLKVTANSQVRFLDKIFRQWLNNQGDLYGYIKFIYRIEFQGGSVVYVGTGLVARMVSRVSGKILDYDNSDLASYTEAAMHRGPARILRCVGLFQVGFSSDVGADFERAEKCRCADAGWKLLNRNDLYRPIDKYRIIALDDWLSDEGMRLFKQLGEDKISESDAVRVMEKRPAL